MPSTVQYLAVLAPILAILAGLWKYYHTPKAPLDRLNEIDNRLEVVEGAVSEMEQLLTGADSADADPGILLNLQDSIDEVRAELTEIRREMQSENDNENT